MQIVKYWCAQVCGCRQHANSLNKHKLLSVGARLNLVQRSFGPVRTLAKDLQITERNVRSKWTDETLSVSFPLSRSLQPPSSDSISVPSLSWSTFCQITAQVYTFTAHTDQTLVLFLTVDCQAKALYTCNLDSRWLITEQLPLQKPS